MLTKLQYISQGLTEQEQYDNIYAVLDAGCQWIQIRWKNQSEVNILKLSEKVKLLTDSYSATLIINDYPTIAKTVDAHGVHLGLTDMNVQQAKQLLHPNQWIGGTANSLQDVTKRINEQVTYIGLGPYKFTNTKDNLSPILGLVGYQNILQNIKNKDIPIYAIGGIELSDVQDIVNTGIYGVAMASAITKSKNKKEYIQKLNQILCNH